MLACYAFRIVVEKRRLQARFTKMRLESKSEQNSVISEIIPFISQLVSETEKTPIALRPLLVDIFGVFRGAK